MPISLTPQQKSRLEQEESLILPLAGSTGAESAAYHNPKTGQEFPNLPLDPRALTRYLRRGLMLGPAPAELKAKWESASAERAAADDAMVAEYEASDQAQIDQGVQDGQFKDAVAAAVTQVLEKLGIDPSVGAEKVAPVPVPEEELEPVQLDFFKTVDDRPKAPSTDGSVASRPDLHLVG
jgi:hypothetical protein